MNGRDTLDYNSVGDAYSLSDAFQVLECQHNWLLHKKVHFFIAEHPSEDVFMSSFKRCLNTMLRELRVRLAQATIGADASWTIGEVYDRMVDGVSVEEDIVLLNEAKLVLENNLQSSNVTMGQEFEEEARVLHSAQKKQTYVPTPQGASPAEKQYFSTLNDEVSLKVLVF
jgi:hypothetical protein